MDLKDLRKRKGYTQEEISVLLGIPIRTYKRYENDESFSSSFKYKQIYQNVAKIPAKTANNIEKQLSIVVFGIGYVGLSLSVLLAKKHHVIAFDIDQTKVDLLNNRVPFISDSKLESILKNDKLDLTAMLVNKEPIKKADIVIIATNTDFDEKTNYYDLSNVLSCIQLVREVNKDVLIVIKSTVSIGFTESLKDKNIIFVPEFLKEGTAILDNLFPSRIIIGADHITPKVKRFAKCLSDISINNKEILYMSSKEAETVKLFSNAYLALRVAYFNELDSFCEDNSLSSENIIKGLSRDQRIGDYYNNPSFGYGGYCLPKDVKQLAASIPHSDVIQSITKANDHRKEYIEQQIIKKIKNKKSVIGFYRLSMKKDSDNYRNSSTLEIAHSLMDKGYKVIIFEPKYINSVTFDELVTRSEIIVTNRLDKRVLPYLDKIYTRDLNGKN